MGDIANRALTRRLDICTGLEHEPVRSRLLRRHRRQRGGLRPDAAVAEEQRGRVGNPAGLDLRQPRPRGARGLRRRKYGGRRRVLVEVHDRAARGSPRRPFAWTRPRDRPTAMACFEPGETVIVIPSWKNTVAGNPTDARRRRDRIHRPVGRRLRGRARPRRTTERRTPARRTTARPRPSVISFKLSGFPSPARTRAPPHTGTRPSMSALLGGATKTWTLHVGDSFTDVPRSQTFYKRIETLLHNGITAGCTATTYCPADPVARASMAIFIAKGLAGGGPNVPPGGSVGGLALQLRRRRRRRLALPGRLPTDSFCKHVHYIAAKNVTAGCAGGGLLPERHGHADPDGVLHREGPRRAAGRPGHPAVLRPRSRHGPLLFLRQREPDHPLHRRARHRRLLQARPLPLGQGHHRGLRRRRPTARTTPSPATPWRSSFRPRST